MEDEYGRLGGDGQRRVWCQPADSSERGRRTGLPTRYAFSSEPLMNVVKEIKLVKVVQAMKMMQLEGGMIAVGVGMWMRCWPQR